MLKTSVATDTLGVNVSYDGRDFFITPYDTDVIAVMCKRHGEWDFYDRKPYKTFAEACEAIFYGTILVDRTERGHINIDMFGNYTGLTPLTYYES